MDDVWHIVCGYLTPREAMHLIAVVRSLRVSSCKPPALRDMYSCVRLLMPSPLPGLKIRPPCLQMQRDVNALAHHYPRSMLAPLRFQTLMEVEWLGDVECWDGDRWTEAIGKVSVIGISVRFSEKAIVYSYDFKVDEM